MPFYQGDPLIHIAIADDHTTYLQAISKFINEWEECRVILQAGNGKELMERLHPGNLPDLVITDLNMPQMNGYEIIRELKKKYPDIKFLVLSMFQDKESMLLLLKAGAQGYACKNDDLAEIRKAILRVMNKGYYFADKAMARLCRQIMETGNMSGIDALSDEEISYLKYICTGKTYKEIASAMGITLRQCEYFRTRLFTRFISCSRTDLAIQSLKKGVIF